MKQCSIHVQEFIIYLWKFIYEFLFLYDTLLFLFNIKLKLTYIFNNNKLLITLNLCLFELNIFTKEGVNNVMRKKKHNNLHGFTILFDYFTNLIILHLYLKFNL